ncbi:hypothetical protein HPP92_028457 [Vanilla planifolia]|uniref:VQ domain-containing protein n=1 Tax=Vanilla planifolia TaxID=51239 RepID=A0A835U5R4_VANPL|nr:hypothetical protein HPP92_028457 [Vanilla planifolia]
MVKTQDQDLMEIERSGLLNQAKPKKKKKQNLQQPLKVVYISNPMRVTTSPSGFRAIVQELTGRHSDIAEILTRQPPVDFPPPPPSASRPSGGLAPPRAVYGYRKVRCHGGSLRRRQRTLLGVSPDRFF